MYPGAHSEFGDENVATFCEKYGRFRTNHLDIWIGFHDLLYTRKGELMKLVIMSLSFQVIDSLLPVCRQNVPVIANKPLVNLAMISELRAYKCAELVRWPMFLGRAPEQERILDLQAVE